MQEHYTKVYQLVVVSMDDIAIFSKTFDEQITDISSVFDRLRAVNISLKTSKFVFWAKMISRCSQKVCLT